MADDSEAHAVTENIVELIGSLESEGGARGPDLARRLELPTPRVRKELRELEALGIVRRTGDKRGTRWWLG